MLLLLNKDIGMDGGSGDGMEIDVDDDDSKEGMVIGDECKDGTCIGDTECDDTETDTAKGLGVDYEVNPLAYSQ
jgi:hypothetical protein